ncbi:uncharacterized protein LOC131625607 [Vicia villosa]|uniref:uncharacterized protein LOC131625607 n=1 Tax=Vicia villosa TaxID=3911 RepID=UPI00273B0644|nr:uncharacterized protein LOC131625607 [Vicia villosa]
MANSVTVNKKTTKHTFSCSFYREDITPLVRLSTRVTGQNLDEFRKTYGHILLMLTTRIDEWGLYTLLQFYDSELRCFTFQDYQLAPTLEEYAHILQIKVQHKDNWKPNGGTHGFYVKFLMREAETLADKEKWKEFNALLAVMIYGLVMFPNIPNFVDLTAICLFMDQNPVPTLLADTYYAIHSRYGKKGSVGGCLPILYEWFSSHLPKSGAFVTTRDSQKWPQRIMGLTANDIVWYHLRTDIEQVITRCGSFGNVPLIGTKGVINYNPKLALRQLGFVLKDKPLDKEIFESVCFEKGTDPDGLEKVRSAWNKIHTEDRTTLGERMLLLRKLILNGLKKELRSACCLSRRFSLSAIAPPPTHRYYTRANHSLQMDQLRDDLIQMRTQVTAQMAQNPADIRVNGEPVIGGPGVIPPAANQGNPRGPPQPTLEGQTTQQIRRAAAIPVLEEDRHEDLFPESEWGFPPDAGRMFRGLEERMRAMEGQGLGMDINDFGLVPGVRVPPKFKVPDFEKYKGNTCPKTHVRAYYRKMHVYSEDEGLLMHFFQDSLTGASLEWYMRLERANIRSWRDLVDAFIKQYQYNVDMAPNRTQLQNLSQKANESFKEYAQKWRELAARVQPPMLEREMMDLFTNTLEGQYYSACSASSSFAELVMIGERIESGIKAGRIQNPSAASSSSGAGGKKPYNGFAKKREGETSATYYGKGKGHVYQQVSAVTIPSTPLQQQPQQQQRHPPRQYQQKSRPPRIFDPIPMTYAQLLAHLLHGDLVQLRTMGPPPAKLPPNYDANAHCEFHSGAAGHDIEHCIGFMHKVQDLLDSKAIEFTPTQGPNVVQNPMPSHGTHAANAIDIVEDIYLVKDVIKLGSLLPLLKKELSRMRLYADSGYLQFEHVRHPKSVKNEINVLSIPYTPTKIPIPARAPPLVITLPGPIPYTSEKAIPWNYGGEVFYQGAKYEIKAPVEKEDVDNVVGIGRMTRSGRIFNPPQNTRDDNAEALAQAKGKRVVEDTVDPGQSSNSEDTVAKEMEEFLKIIKKSEYKVVDQLSQTQSKISILQLLLCSETHRNALLRLLGTAFVPPEISVNQLEGVVSNINAGNGLGFTDADLPSEGRNHNRALHISVECKGTMLSRVLVDNGSSLNVLPKSSLMRLDYSGVEIRPSELTVRAFGEVDLPIMIGPQLFTITFFVMDIHPYYSCLLGRPWIHAAGAVTSTLHQKLKFATQGKIVTVCGEEEHVVSHLASFKYIDVEGEVHETPCQAFEAVQTIKIPYVEKKKLEAPMSSLKEAKAVVESGHPEGWGRVLDLPIKQDKCGIGYQLGQSSSDGSFKKPGTFVPIKFSSAGIVKDHVCAADDEDGRLKFADKGKNHMKVDDDPLNVADTNYAEPVDINMAIESLNNKVTFNTDVEESFETKITEGLKEKTSKATEDLRVKLQQIRISDVPPEDVNLVNVGKPLSQIEELEKCLVKEREKGNYGNP